MIEKVTQKKEQRIIHKRTFNGIVRSTGSAKTIYVRVATVKTHPKYRKQYTTHKIYAVHDEKGNAVIGDIVSFEECRPLSKTKRWRLTQVVRHTV